MGNGYEPEHEYEHQPSYVPDYDDDLVYYDERSGQLFDLGTIASFLVGDKVKDKKLNYGGHPKVDIVKPHIIKKKVVTTKTVVKKVEHIARKHKTLHHAHSGHFEFDKYVEKPVVVQKKFVVEKPVVVHKKVTVEKPVVVK